MAADGAVAENLVSIPGSQCFFVTLLRGGWDSGYAIKGGKNRRSDEIERVFVQKM